MNREEKAFEFAQDTVKQIMTLSTGIIVLTVTFLKDILPKGTDTCWLEWAWGSYLASIFFGLFALMALTGTLGDSAGNINRRTIRITASLQVILFFLALLFTLIFGFKVF